MALSLGGMRAAAYPLSSTQNRASVLPASFLGGPGKTYGRRASRGRKGLFCPIFGRARRWSWFGKKRGLEGEVESYCEIIKFSYYEAIMLIYYIYMLFIFK